MAKPDSQGQGLGWMSSDFMPFFFYVSSHDRSTGHFCGRKNEQVLSCWVVMIIPIPLPQKRLWQKVCWCWGRGIGISRKNVIRLMGKTSNSVLGKVVSKCMTARGTTTLLLRSLGSQVVRTKCMFWFCLQLPSTTTEDMTSLCLFILVGLIRL